MVLAQLVARHRLMPRDPLQADPDEGLDLLLGDGRPDLDPAQVNLLQP